MKHGAAGVNKKKLVIPSLQQVVKLSIRTGTNIAAAPNI
jgi:hypothetical protein